MSTNNFSILIIYYLLLFISRFRGCLYLSNFFEKFQKGFFFLFSKFQLKHKGRIR